MPAIADEQISNYGVDETGPVEVEWSGADGALWVKIPEEFVRAGTGEKGQETATRLLEDVDKTGVLQDGKKLEIDPEKPWEPGLYVVTTGVVFNLGSLGSDSKFTVRFPTGLSNDNRATTALTYWTDHPEWVRAVRREFATNELTRESMQWYCLDYELGVRAGKSSTTTQNTSK